MSQRWKLFLLTGLMIVMLVLIARQSLNIYQNIKQVHAPTPQTRQDKELQIHHWETIRELAQKCGMSEKEVFSYLQITPQPGDENLTLRALKNKYNKTQDEMESNLKILITNSARKHGTTR
ncbi:MAG: hypothetical protein CVU90_13755 [Firmicutes bacterium HGW-Firmicutes-15]|nr:MAG: hypothetical protein CVU90_13755 [Firmicutes bacterium HGW-Firmicutes-15]